VVALAWQRFEAGVGADGVELLSAAVTTPPPSTPSSTQMEISPPDAPDVVRDEPGECPIRGKTLVKSDPAPAEEPASPPVAPAGRRADLLQASARSESTSPVPKQTMGMDYVPAFADAAGPRFASPRQS
jgi:hypothetical protein